MTLTREKLAELKPISERIRDAFDNADWERKPYPGYLSYHYLLAAVFPREQFPKAWRYSSNGGPPGCAMAFRKALNRLEMRGTYFDDAMQIEYFRRPQP